MYPNGKLKTRHISLNQTDNQGFKLKNNLQNNGSFEYERKARIRIGSVNTSTSKSEVNKRTIINMQTLKRSEVWGRSKAVRNLESRLARGKTSDYRPSQLKIHSNTNERNDISIKGKSDSFTAGYRTLDSFHMTKQAIRKNPLANLVSTNY